MHTSLISRARFVTSLIAVLFVVSGTHAHAATNLIQNPSFTTPSAGNQFIPLSWSVAGFDTTYAGHYPVSGPNASDTIAAEITVTACTNTPCGDAKWVFDAVPLVAQEGALYTFGDDYLATATSSLVAAFTHADNSTTYLPLGVPLPPTNGAWKTLTQNFTIPASNSPITSVSVYHSISAVGSITTDNYTLVKTKDATENLLPTGVVTLAFDDGWDSQFTNAFPTMLSYGLPGSFYIISHTMQDSSAHDVFADPAATIDMHIATTTSSISWSPLYLDPSSNKYFFSDTYTAAGTTTVTAHYTASTTPGSLSKVFPAGTNVRAELEFQLPTTIDAGSFGITQQTATGTLSVSGTPSLMELLDDYMTARQVKILQESGSEIGSHSQDHCNLAQLDVNAADTTSCARIPNGPTSAAAQIIDSRADLLPVITPPLDTFVYPYGGFTTNVENILQTNGYIAGRTTIAGYNTRASDFFALQTQPVDASTTPEMVKGWIDTAVANHFWLILTFHQVDDPITIMNKGEQGGTTPQIFAYLTQYLHDQNIPVKTMRDEINALNSMVTPVDTTAPVITLTGSATVTLSVGASYTEEGATALDDHDGTVSVTVGGDAVNTGVAGVYTVTYNAVDAAGNHALAVTRTVTVSAPASGGSSSSSSGGGGGGGGSSSGGGSSATPGFVTTSTPVGTTSGSVLGATTFNFTKDLSVGSTGIDVTELQKVLIAGKFLGIPAPTGTFGPLTKAAVIAYQTAKGITPTSGFVGPLTRGVLNKGVTVVSVNTPSIAAQIAALLAQIAILKAKLTGSVASATLSP